MLEYSGPIIVIAGPTASGKSSIAMKLAKEINGVIINADSKQVYKEISIGTARPTKTEMGNISHHLFGHISLKDGYSIFQYQKDVEDVLKNLESNEIPILVGGSGLYIDSVLFKYNLVDNEIDPVKREKLSKMRTTELQHMIPTAVLNSLNESDSKNPVRLIRVIENLCMKPDKKRDRPLSHIYFVIDQSKEILNKNIEQRVEKMIQNGLKEENKRIRELGLDKYLSVKTIGYQEFDGYFEGEKSIEEVKEEIINHTKQYAKRQRTWFRKHKHAKWSNDYNYILEQSLKFINI